MYDGWRSVGWPSFVYFISLMVFGQFIVMNIFLVSQEALLLTPAARDVGRPASFQAKEATFKHYLH
jgi:hypothetical protein